MILTMQLLNLVAALIKAKVTFSLLYPAAFHHLQHIFSPCQTPLPSHLLLAPQGRRFHLPRNGSSFIGDAVCCAVPGAEPLCHRKKLLSLKCMNMCKICTHAYQESDVLLRAQPWHCPLSKASRFQKLLRLTGRTGRVRRGLGTSLLASKE